MLRPTRTLRDPDAGWRAVVRTSIAAPVAVATGAATPAIEPGVVSMVLLALLGLSACLLTAASVPRGLLAVVSPRLVAHRPDLAFGGLALLVALAVGFLLGGAA